jgi:hypothetical protein
MVTSFEALDSPLLFSPTEFRQCEAPLLLGAKTLFLLALLFPAFRFLALALQPK